jgi:hypothetical protein
MRRVELEVFKIVRVVDVDDPGLAVEDNVVEDDKEIIRYEIYFTRKPGEQGYVKGVGPYGVGMRIGEVWPDEELLRSLVEDELPKDEEFGPSVGKTRYSIGGGKLEKVQVVSDEELEIILRAAGVDRGLENRA